MSLPSQRPTATPNASAPALEPQPQEEPTTGEPVQNSLTGKLSSQTRFNILIISVVGAISILLLLFGSFDGKVVRVISTLVLFGIFTFLSSQDAKRLKTEGLIRLSQMSNLYMLLLSLILIWGSLAVDPVEDAVIIPLTCFIPALVKVGVLAVEKLSPLIRHPQKQLALSAYFSVAGLVLLTFLFTFPIGLYRIVTFADWYWRFVVAVVLFTALALSITFIILWALKKDDSEGSDFTVGKSVSRVSLPPAASSPAPVAADDVRPQPQPEPAPTRAVPVQVQAPQLARPVASPLPWPVFPDGRPLPAKNNGRPDFSALTALAQQYETAERQFFG